MPVTAMLGAAAVVVLRVAPAQLHSFPTRRSSDLADSRDSTRRSRKARKRRWFSTSTRSTSGAPGSRDRKSTRLNSSHSQISYAVFCLKKQNQRTQPRSTPARRDTRGGRRAAGDRSHSDAGHSDARRCCCGSASSGPRTATLFPYTTLFRSRGFARLHAPLQEGQEAPVVFDQHPQHFGSAGIARSEEHTSELQSQSNLVCRLLLEKTKPADPTPKHTCSPRHSRRSSCCW